MVTATRVLAWISLLPNACLPGFTEPDADSISAPCTMKHTFKFQRQITEELQLTIDYPNDADAWDIFVDSLQTASQSKDWKQVLVDKPEHVESSVNFTF